MKKRIFSLLIVLVMMLQTIPVYAAGGTLMVNSIEDLFSINTMLDANVILNTDLELVINDDFVREYGASSIGESSPFTGVFNGNNHTITLDITTDKKSYALFHYLNGATVSNLNIVVKNFQTSSTSSNISFSGLAHIVRNSKITAGVSYNSNQNGKVMFLSNNSMRNLTISSIANNCGGDNQIYVKKSYMNLLSAPEDTNLVFGAVAVVSDGYTTVTQLDNGNDDDLDTENHAYVLVPAKLGSFIIGGLIGEVKSGGAGSAKGDGMVVFQSFVDNDRKVDGLKTIIGGNIGLINENASGYVSSGNGNFVKVALYSFGYAQDFTAGGYIGQNDGIAHVSHTSSSFTFPSETVKFINDDYSDSAVVNIGGILGKNSGEFKNHSTATNNVGNKIDAGNATVNLGSILGHNVGNAKVESSNNGISLQIDDVKSNRNSSFGYMIGKVEDTENINVSYNIINAVDEKSLKGDYEWIDHPFGGIRENSRVEGFKNNYWGYMDYAEIGKPSQIYFMIPMNYFGDTPPEMEDSDFPFLAVYGYLNYSDSNNKFLTFQNKVNNGIGTLTLSQDCVVGTRIKIDVISEDAAYDWSGHYYLYEDILGKLKEEDKKDEEDEDKKEDQEDEEDKKDDEDLEEDDEENKEEEDKDKDKHHKEDEFLGPEEYLKDFNQAVIIDETGKGEPLPTFNSSEDSIVKFNYHDLKYEFVKNDIEFDDIKGEKYRRDIIHAANRLVVKGVGNNKFEPARPITRAEFATMVVRSLGLLPIGEPEFDDVSKDKWYYDYVNAAASWKIIYGVGNNKFEPEDNITREEAMLILTRAAENIIMKNDFECILKDSSLFIANDTDDFSDWAEEGYRDNLRYGIVSLRDNYKSSPKEPITRAETANAILNLLRNFELIDYVR